LPKALHARAAVPMERAPMETVLARRRCWRGGALRDTWKRAWPGFLDALLGVAWCLAWFGGLFVCGRDEGWHNVPIYRQREARRVTIRVAVGLPARKTKEQRMMTRLLTIRVTVELMARKTKERRKCSATLDFPLIKACTKTDHLAVLNVVPLQVTNYSDLQNKIMH
jgi:hypothetical protein